MRDIGKKKVSNPFGNHLPCDSAKRMLGAAMKVVKTKWPDNGRCSIS
jgi:hypothetical protein